MNVVFIWLSLAACLGEVALAVLSFWLGQKYSEVEPGTENEKEKLIQADNNDSSSSEVPIEVPVDPSALRLKL